MGKAKQHGLVFRNDVGIDGDLFTAPITDSYADFMSGFYKYLPSSQRYYRPIDAPPIVSGTSGEATTINETIDSSVFERWHKNPTYRPKNLIDWAQRQGVTIDGLSSTVRADNPRIVVADVYPPLMPTPSSTELPKKTA